MYAIRSYYDMPFGTYQGNSKEALTSAIRIMKETAADAVKLEGVITSYSIHYTKLYESALGPKPEKLALIESDRMAPTEITFFASAGAVMYFHGLLPSLPALIIISMPLEAAKSAVV